MTEIIYTQLLFYAFLLKCPMPNYAPSSFALSHFQFNILWPIAFYYANVLFLMEIFLVDTHFFRKVTRV